MVMSVLDLDSVGFDLTAYDLHHSLCSTIALMAVSP